MTLSCRSCMVPLTVALAAFAIGCGARQDARATGASGDADRPASEARRARRAQEEAEMVHAMSARRRIELADAAQGAERLEEKADLDARPPGARRAKEALDRLTPFAVVREGARGVIVGMDDSVLFEGDTAELMWTARERLDRVAQALHEVKARSVVVRGHMDRSGDDRRDRDLSRCRAEAVRAYLSSRAVAPERTRAEGIGATEPAASNASSEGKSGNRRVEIVVEEIGALPSKR